MIYQLYKLSTQILARYAPTYLQNRASKGKEEPARLAERYGIASYNRPPGTLVWIHAASVGEARSILALVNLLLKRHPDWYVLVTTGTVTSARLLTHELPARAFHQYLPLDVPDWTQSFLNHWKPNIVVWVEQELWPNMIDTIHADNTPIILANGRLTESSYKRWRYLKPLIQKMLRPFHAIYAQSKYDGQRYEALAGREVLANGNLKYASLPLPFQKPKLESLQQITQTRPVWLATSTHMGEEELIAQAHRLLLQQRSDALLILVPRHIDRGTQIATRLKEEKLNCCQRSLDEAIQEQTQVYIADTMGELGTFYRLANIAFIGGSLVPIGGHNLIEPAQLGCLSIHGPYMENFKEIAEQFSSNKIGYQIETPEDLAKLVLHFLNNPDYVKKIGQAAKDFVAQQGQILDELVAEIETAVK